MTATRRHARLARRTYLGVGVRGELVGDDHVRGEDELDALLGGQLLEGLGQVELVLLF